MTLDLYSYGRANRQDGRSMSRVGNETLTFVCAGCGCSATAGDPRLISTIGWKLLPVRSADTDRPALCPRCARRSSVTALM